MPGKSVSSNALSFGSIRKACHCSLLTKPMRRPASAGMRGACGWVTARMPVGSWNSSVVIVLSLLSNTGAREPLHELVEDHCIEQSDRDTDDQGPGHQRAPVEDVAADERGSKPDGHDLLGPRGHVDDGVE